MNKTDTLMTVILIAKTSTEWLFIGKISLKCNCHQIVFRFNKINRTF